MGVELVAPMSLFTSEGVLSWSKTGTSQLSNPRVKRPLPTNEIGVLLGRYGLDVTWRSLVATHAVLSYDSVRSGMLLADPDFAAAPRFDVDLLAGYTVGEVSILYEFSLAQVDPSSRKSEGQYFTPDDMADFMAGLSDGFEKDGVWLDPCSGLGNLSFALALRAADPEEFVANRLILVDRDQLALVIARGLFFLHFFKSDGALLGKLASSFIHLDFLTAETLPAHDFAILNPPYARADADDRFETSPARDLYAYFLERVAKTSRGFISVTPQSFTNGKKFAVLRRLLLARFNNLEITCWDNVPDSIFKGIKFGSTNSNTANSTRAAVIVARNTEIPQRRITPLLRWLTAQRKEMFQTVGLKLTAAPLSEDIFPKNYAGLDALYSDVTTGAGWAPLTSHVSPTPTAFALIVPSTPRYFISAVKRDLSRSSFHVLHFVSAEARDRLYPVLNSSLLYWWWRVNDGGMTLSKATLLSLPISDAVTVDRPLCEALEASEGTNLVAKLNSGKSNENVRHPAVLVDRVNRSLFDSVTAEALLRTHDNSNI